MTDFIQIGNVSLATERLGTGGNALVVQGGTGGGGGGGTATSPSDITSGIDNSGILVAIRDNAIAPPVSPIVNGSIAVAATSQVVLASSATRKYIEVANYSSDDLWIQFGGAAGIDNGFKIAAGDPNWYSPPQLAMQLSVYIFGATAGQKFAILAG